MRLKQISRGRDENGTFQMDIIVNGHVPTLTDMPDVRLMPYVDQLVHTATGALLPRPEMAQIPLQSQCNIT